MTDISTSRNERLSAIADYMEQLENFDDATFLRSLRSESVPVCSTCGDKMTPEWHCYDCGGPTSV